MTRIEKLLTDIRDRLSAAAPEKQTLGMKEAAAFLGLSVSKLGYMVSLYEIPFVPISSKKKRGRVTFRLESLREWQRKHEVRCSDDEVRLLFGKRVS